jgi:O-antigen ligase
MNARPSWPRGLTLPQRRLAEMRGFDRWLVPLLGVMLLVRVLTDDRSSPNSHQSGSLNLSGAIAVLFIVLAAGVLLRWRRGMRVTALATLWLCIWTAVAVSTHGASTETLREGVREASVIALAVIVYNARAAVTVTAATRLVQFIGLVPGVLAVYQLAAHTGMDIAGNLRSNGTFAHPDSAAMFFAIAAPASLWLYLDNGRRLLDALLTALFATALLATSSIDGLLTLAAMLIALGALRPDTTRVKLVPFAIAGLALLAFFATPLGAKRIATETSTSLASEPNSSLAWRFHKWKTLLPDWERSPLFGQGIGTTTTTEAIPGNRFAGKPPHNEYVRYLVETGIVGLAILLWAVLILIRSVLRMRRARGAGDEAALNATTLAIVVIVGCLVNSMADNTLLNSPTCYAAALIVVAVLGLPAATGMRRAQRLSTA